MSITSISPRIFTSPLMRRQEEDERKEDPQEKLKISTERGDLMIEQYFREETSQLEASDSLEKFKNLDEWEKERELLREEFQEMLGIKHLLKQPRTDLNAFVTNIAQEGGIIVETLVFESLTNLYVAANLYRPANNNNPKPLPAVIYLCGHGSLEKDGVRYGNKATHKGYGIWFAAQDIICLMLDTLERGEIQGNHYGGYTNGDTSWVNRGYTPAGVEVWNCMRGMDYLRSRKEIDPERITLTGRSGGATCSYFTTVVDKRIHSVAAAAGITNLKSHMESAVEDHCDCAYPWAVNTYRWSFAKVVALIAPREVFMANTDNDHHFPLWGVVDVHNKSEPIYKLFEDSKKLELYTAAGEHKDWQKLSAPLCKRVVKVLTGHDAKGNVDLSIFKPEQLRVFRDEQPKDAINANIAKLFVPVANSPSIPQDKKEWKELCHLKLKMLKEKSFRAWPKQAEELNVKKVFSETQLDIQFEAFDFTSQGNIRLRLYLAHQSGLKKPELVELSVMDQKSWGKFLATFCQSFAIQLKDEVLPNHDEKSFKNTKQMLASSPLVMAYIAPRGVGPTIWGQSERNKIDHLRRFHLLGQSLNGMQIWDVQRTIKALQTIENMENVRLQLESCGQMAAVALCASLPLPKVMQPKMITQLVLHRLPHTYEQGPYIPNIQRILDIPLTIAMVAERCQIIFFDTHGKPWEFAQKVAAKLDWNNNQLQIRENE